MENLAAWGLELAPQQIDDFTMVTYNAGIEDFMRSLQGRINKNEIADDVRAAILRTIDLNIDYVHGARMAVDQEMYSE